MSTPTTAPATAVPRSSYTVFGALAGLSAIGVLLQALWAGLFLQDEGRRDEGWVDVHALGAHVTTALAFLTLVWAVWKLRSRSDLWIGALVFFVAIVVESYLGGRIRDEGEGALTIIHVPLAMILMATAVWLPLRARAGRRAT